MSELTPQEEKYIELALEPKFKNDKGQIAYTIASSWDYIPNDEYKKDCNTINEWLACKVFGDKSKTSEIELLKEKFKKVKNIWAGQKHRTGFANIDKFKQWVAKAKEHKSCGFVKDDDKIGELIVKYERGDFGFRTFKNFYKWYEDQPKECCYCGTSEQDLEILFKVKNDESERCKKLYSKKRGFTATLQIEKLNPNKPYNEKNCALACAFCNNAKSDMVNEENFREFAKAHIKPLLDRFIKGKSNEMPFFDEGDSKIYQKDRRI